MKYVIFVLCSLVAFPVFAQEDLGSGKATTLKKDQPAPYDGTLLDPVAVATILAAREYAQKQCDLDKSLSLAKQQAKYELDVNSLKIERDTIKEKYQIVMEIKNQEINRLTDVLSKNDKANNWKYVWFIGGVILGAATTIGISYAIIGAR